MTKLVSSGSVGQPDERPPVVERDGRRLLGTLVHRLLRALGANAAIDEATLVEQARRLASREESADLEDVEATLAEAARAFVELRRRPDVAALFADAECLYEVPFSMIADTRLKPRATTPGDMRPADTRPRATDGADGIDRGTQIVRGSIDCLARFSGGRVVVVEIKTGQPRAWHQEQLDWYLAAARSLFPGEQVEGLILYA